jgi:hypothetical protein
MSFGFSVGDFIAVGSLILDIKNCLQDTGGSKSDFQELLGSWSRLMMRLNIWTLSNPEARSLTFSRQSNARLSTADNLWNTFSVGWGSTISRLGLRAKEVTCEVPQISLVGWWISRTTHGSFSGISIRMLELSLCYWQSLGWREWRPKRSKVNAIRSNW